MVATGVVSLIDRTKTPKIHNSVIPLGYDAVSVDKVHKEYRNLALEHEGGDGEKTLGEAEMTFIHGASITSSFLVFHCLLLKYLNKGADESERNNLLNNFL